MARTLQTACQSPQESRRCLYCTCAAVQDQTRMSSLEAAWSSYPLLFSPDNGPAGERYIVSHGQSKAMRKRDGGSPSASRLRSTNISQGSIWNRLMSRRTWEAALLVYTLLYEQLEPHPLRRSVGASNSSNITARRKAPWSWVL